LGHEGEGSLFQYLREQGWVESLSAGQQLEYNGGAMFGLNIALTQAGMSHVDEIISQVFHTLELVKSRGVNPERYQEMQQISKIHFDFQQAGREIDYVRQLSVQLAEYAPAEILRGPYLMREYPPAQIHELLAFLNKDNVLVALTAPEVDTDQTTERYGVDYRVSAVTTGQWQSEASKAIHLPAPNPFLPEDTASHMAQSDTVPVRLEAPEGVELWFGQSHEFSLPRGSINVLLENPHARRSASDAVLNALFAELVAERINLKAYPANLAGLHAQVNASRRGIALSTSGLNDKQAVLLELVLQELAGAELEQGRFDVLRQQAVRRWRNQLRLPPYQVLGGELRNLLYQPYYDAASLADAAEQLSFEELQTYIKEFRLGAVANIMVYGSFVKDDATEAAKLVRTYFANGMEPAAGTDVLVLPEGSRFWRELALDHKDTAVIQYFQGASDSNRDRVLMGLTAQIIKPGYFHQLRTEQQFGYIVYAAPAVLERTPGLMLVVQSPSRSLNDIYAASAEFMRESGDEFAAMTEQEFDQHRQTLIDLLTEPAKNIDEEFGRYWDQLMQGYQQFNRTEQLVAELETLKLKEWQAFFQQQILGSQGRQLLISESAERANDRVQAATTEVEAVGEFKQKLEGRAYP
jgi:secreted Zn-dependent insulinase-like peptidase